MMQPEIDHQPDGAEMVELISALKTMGLEDLNPAEIAPEFRVPLIRLARKSNATLAKSTLASRRSDLRRFVRWCDGDAKPPLSSLTAIADLMEAHVLAVGGTLSKGTAQRVGSSLSLLADALGSDEAARGARERRRLAVRATQKRQHVHGAVFLKPRLTVPQMQAMRASIEESSTLPLRRLRDLAIFDTMCDLLARRSEIVGLCLRDIDLEAGTVRISYSKTDQAGHGALFTISPRTVTSLDAWLEASGLAGRAGTLPAFVAVMNSGQLRLGSDDLPAPLDGKSIARILQRYADPLGIVGVAGHSIRRSMARALHEAGVPEGEIVTKGRWSSLEQMREYVGLTAPIQGASALIF